jgi:RNA polymerase sigma factor (TIGR02999 family)
MATKKQIAVTVTTNRDVTSLLAAWSDGDEQALAEVVPLIYNELVQLARRRLGRERDNHTLQPTVLVNEAYLRLVDQTRVKWANRGHFYAVAAQTMRRVLLDHARKRQTARRGGNFIVVPLEELGDAGAGLGASDHQVASVLKLDEALQRLEKLDPRKSKLVELRFFGGLSIEEAADVSGVSPGTVMRDWTLAKAWLSRELRE